MSSRDSWLLWTLGYPCSLNQVAGKAKNAAYKKKTPPRYSYNGVTVTLLCLPISCCAHPHRSVTGCRSIAKVVSQVHAFQEAVYPYSPDRDLQGYLRRRIARFTTSDIHLLAANSDANFQQSSERQTRRIQDTLRRVKATFQWDMLSQPGVRGQHLDMYEPKSEAPCPDHSAQTLPGPRLENIFWYQLTVCQKHLNFSQ